MSAADVHVKKAAKNRRAAQKKVKANAARAEKKKKRGFSALFHSKKSQSTAAKKGKVSTRKAPSPAEPKTGKKGRTGMIVLKILIFCVVVGLLGGSAMLLISGAMVRSTRDRVIDASAAAGMPEFDCILVLGCGVDSAGNPSTMLRDRVQVGIELYQAGVSPRLLMSGDHGSDEYDEVNAMKKLAVEAEIDPDAVFCDHAGFSTWESMVRAKKIFGAKRILVVTQEYHLYRALYMAKKLGLDAYGVSADRREYGGQWMRDLREIGARTKGFFSALLDLPPKYLGDPIPLDGKGSSTDG